MTVTKIDIKNAFNSINQEAIIYALRNNGCAPLWVAYIKIFMEFRFCKLYYNPKEEPTVMRARAGVPQGDSMSSFLFCLAIDIVLKNLKDKELIPGSYVDGLFIGHSPTRPSSDVVRMVEAEIQKVGLELKVEKC